MTYRTPAEQLQTLIRDGVELARTARRNKKSLAGDNFYANRLVELHADATNAFRQLTNPSVADTLPLAELAEIVFGIGTQPKDRAAAARELLFALKTMTWSNERKPAIDEEEGLFPVMILSQASRRYLVSVGRQMNGCFSVGWHDASLVMMRRLLEICLIEAFEARGITAKITDANGNYLQLSDLIRATLSEPIWNLSRNAKTSLPRLRSLGHMSAHGRHFNARKSDVEDIRKDCRIIIEEVLHHAKLL